MLSIVCIIVSAAVDIPSNHTVDLSQIRQRIKESVSLFGVFCAIPVIEAVTCDNNALIRSDDAELVIRAAYRISAVSFRCR